MPGRGIWVYYLCKDCPGKSFGIVRDRSSSSFAVYGERILTH
jgi:hypothetical protein